MGPSVLGTIVKSAFKSSEASPFTGNLLPAMRHESHAAHQDDGVDAGLVECNSSEARQDQSYHID